MKPFLKSDLVPMIEESRAEKDDILAVFNGFTAGRSMVSKVIRRLDTVKWEGKVHKSAINHVYRRFLLKDGSSFICESHLSGGVQITPYIHLLRACKSGEVTRIHEKNLLITAEHMADLWNRHLEVHGSGYDKRMIVLYYLWIRALRKKGKAPLLQNKSKYTCNELWMERGDGLDPHVFLNHLSMPEQCFIDVFGEPSAVVHGRGDFIYSSTY